MTVRVAIDGAGVVSRLVARGHAGRGRAGENVACAAVTVLLRTAYETLSARVGILATFQAPVPGVFDIVIEKYDAEATVAACAITDFLLTGLSGVQRDFPDAVSLQVER